MPDGYEARVNETLGLKIQDPCRQSFCSRIKCMIEFWKVNNPDYHALGVWPLSEQEQHDDMKFFFCGAFTEDLVYTGLNVKFVHHFLVTMKKKEDGKLKSFTHMHKFWMLSNGGQKLLVSHCHGVSGLALMLGSQDSRKSMLQQRKKEMSMTWQQT